MVFVLKSYSQELVIKTEKRFEVINITSHVDEVVRESGVREGFCLIFVPHATAALIINEYEPRITSDYIKWIVEVFKPGGGWKHDEIDDNAHAHIASSIIGTSRVLPVRGGNLVRGTWQEIMLVELDGPRTRRVIIQIIGE